MKKTHLLDQTTTPDGHAMTLHEHDGVYIIRINGAELMSTRHHDSEEKIAQLACSHIRLVAKNAKVLIGGLGLGFTLRSALSHLPAAATVIVAEIMPAVIAWNRIPEYRLGGDAMADSRVQVISADVADVLRKSHGVFDAIILDIDNGASAMSSESNKRLYQSAGLALARSALKSDGCLAVWSASDDPVFAKTMTKAGFHVIVERARAHPSSGSWHTLFIGRVA